MTAIAEGPYFEELAAGQVFDGAPGVTLTAGHAAVHQAVVGDRLRLPLDEHLCGEVTGGATPAHPALVWDVAIGQSTLVTHHVKANLFYRGLVFRRLPVIGDTLRTSTEVVALRQNRPKPGRRPTGLAVLRISTMDQDGTPVLDFWRCAMLPLRNPEVVTGHDADLDSVGAAAAGVDLVEAATGALAGWRLDRFRDRVAGRHFSDVAEGERWEVGGGDVVSGAPELARLTLNIAQVHHDVRAAGGSRRLVYGGHTIGLALSQAARVLPNLVTVVAWHGCDHVGPVHEGDTLCSEIVVERRSPLPGGGGLVHLRSLVAAVGDGEPRNVLDWRFVAVMA
ncbi:MaoC family dehydratase [Microtetraspora sp. NBRC 16547]|uniref:MaoC family dehydratase n=1 Tax=Microtetraspora sp. NBRC 16547 TaxID=3030993 RepID=UPI0024A15AC8|nr:MaoC family dehydratase [Microtetraspora sp. NBRC 16547]GLW98425.1 acyl dehydratase [Microtetraspora sp. NBRC 16547]